MEAGCAWRGQTLFLQPHQQKSSKMKTWLYNSTRLFHWVHILSQSKSKVSWVTVWGLRYNGGRASKYSCRGTRCVGCRKMIEIGLENRRMISMCGKSLDTAIQLASVYFILICTHCEAICERKHVTSLYDNWKVGIYSLMFPLNSIAFNAVDQP